MRGSKEGNLGFLNDYRRMNVAITRAKHFLWIVGNSKTLENNENWDHLVEYTKSKEKCYMRIKNQEEYENGKLLDLI